MTPTRRDLIEAAWIAAKWQFPDGYTIEQFAADTGDWDFWPIVVQGALAGAIMVRGCDMHVCVQEQHFKRWATPSLYRRVLNHKRKHGRLRTVVAEQHQAGRDFVERFGFRVYGNRGLTLLYELR